VIVVVIRADPEQVAVLHVTTMGAIEDFAPPSTTLVESMTTNDTGVLVVRIAAIAGTTGAGAGVAGIFAGGVGLGLGFWSGVGLGLGAAGTGAISRANWILAATGGEEESVAVITTVKLPEEVGVPLMAPVAALIDRPAGSPVAAQLSVPVPPVAFTFAE
jgi:hypothetical protein